MPNCAHIGLEARRGEVPVEQSPVSQLDRLNKSIDQLARNHPIRMLAITFALEAALVISLGFAAARFTGSPNPKCTGALNEKHR